MLCACVLVGGVCRWRSTVVGVDYDNVQREKEIATRDLSESWGYGTTFIDEPNREDGPIQIHPLLHDGSCNYTMGAR